jgi:hypothetical protein
MPYSGSWACNGEVLLRKESTAWGVPLDCCKKLTVVHVQHEEGVVVEVEEEEQVEEGEQVDVLEQ